MPATPRARISTVGSWLGWKIQIGNRGRSRGKRFLPGDSHGDGVNYHSIPADTYAGSLLAPSSRGKQLVRGVVV